ncbi:uncharacterized protein RHIMIDRAFT_235869 [Rhizopus microsporus ATCC 52813]|uniref:BRCT domain-containing protein n=1 Tax=Rhizopus microsporus ATCC 52813 TaxID=1340429 RepID=A0A2G4SYQ5_RHIZD|nr:uncharacterized protein RHIMIDRAFT_235869 [Rhizopus microsporus ATCC 52813]PHZ13874.1 hypothetical protein RHIMIDRAFT_235869 [Rhizopus microsporus ATCC 52813]
MNLMPTMEITGDSFHFKRKYTSVTKRRPRTTLTGISKRQNIKKESQLNKRAIQDELGIEAIRYSQPVLEGYVLYIDKSLSNRKALAQIAIAMRAQVKDTMDKKSVTHLIHGPKTGNTNSKVIHDALKHGIHRVSPLWLTTCYKEQQYVSTELYPYDVDPRKERLKPEESGDVEDPFNVKEKIPDYEEEEKEEGRNDHQMRIDNYFFVKDSNNNVSQQQQQQQEKEEEKEEQKEMNEAERKEYEERAKMIREIVEARRAKIEANNKKSRQSPRQQSQKKSTKRTQLFPPTSEYFSYEGLKIWYGEQPLEP